jgi:hypothetical protein
LNNIGRLFPLNQTHSGLIGGLSFSVTSILNYIHRGIGDLTVHGSDHSREIEAIAIDVMNKCNLKTGKCHTSSFEEYIVVSAAWLHDLGNIYGRKDHNQKSCDIIEKLYPSYLWCLLANAVEPVKWLCYSHVSSVDMNTVPEFIDIEGGVKLRYLAALFRLLDASDMANRRAPLVVYELLKDHFEDPHSKDFWKSHQAIMDVSFPEDENSIIITLIDKKKADLAVQDFKRNLDSVKPILKEYDFPWLDYRLKKIEKVPKNDAGKKL